jgi:hypothetical protein
VGVQSAKPALPVCVTLWIGPRLGRVERACLRSWLRQGHEVHLYAYDRPEGVPDGVMLKDAAEVVPEHRVVHYHTGSVSLFSNLFRYALQLAGRGTWLDCDIYLLKPLDGARPYLFGEEAPGVIGTGVLRLPARSPILPPLLSIFEERAVPDWLPWRARLAALWRRLSRGRIGLDRMPWGSTGPKAFTALAHRHGLAGLALPAATFCPFGWPEADWIRQPRELFEDRIGPATIGIHLWNERIKHFKDVAAPEGSFLARLQQEGV